MNEAPDYSAAYVILRTDQPAGLAGHGLTFTSGRGNELCVAAIESMAPLLVGRTLEELTADLGAFWSSLADAQQLRWVGPEKGVIHMATGALVNAVWDLYAKVDGKPLWQLLADMSPGSSRRGPSASPSCGPTAIPPTRPRRAGWATTTTRCDASAARASRRAGRTSRSRSGVISMTTCGGSVSSATRSVRTAS